MPSCSKELNDIITKYFGEENKDEKCIKFLESRNYILTKQWEWIKPVSSHTINEEEFNCLKYLVDEWDFGGIVK